MGNILIILLDSNLFQTQFFLWYFVILEITGIRLSSMYSPQFDAKKTMNKNYVKDSEISSMKTPN